MKTKFLLMGIAAVMLLACKDDKKNEIESFGSEAEMTTEEAKEMKLFKQDSIDALSINGYKVELISGHKDGGKTTIEYESLFQMLAEIRADAKKEMLPKEELNSKIEHYKDFYKGGRVILHVERSIIGAANTENFKIIVKDKDDREIHREGFKSDIPEPSTSGWWNNAIVFIEKRIQTPFYIYVVDVLEDEPYKFEVTPIKK